jgi:ribosomal protein S18 acetylase RimI-like enzyme
MGAAIRPPGPTDRPRPDGSDVRVVGVDGVPDAASALAQAFYDDPHMSWIVRDDGVRLRRLTEGIETFIRAMWLPQGELYLLESGAGAAAWMRPGEQHVSLLAQARMAPATLRALRGDVVRLLRAFTYIERKHPGAPDHWYLAMVGVVPGWQGRGYGAALMRPVLERCDAERVPAYLEASSPRNRALYERHGFEVVEECTYARDAPPLWRMWREPRG